LKRKFIDKIFIQLNVKRVQGLIGIILTTCIFIGAIIIEPFEDNSFTFCLFKNITGQPCPGCGMGRSIIYLLHGDFETAFQLNSLVFVLLPILIMTWLGSIYMVIKDKELPFEFLKKRKIRNILTFLFLILVIIYYTHKLLLYNKII